MNKKQKKVLIRIIAAAALMILLSLLPARGLSQAGAVSDTISCNRI